MSISAKDFQKICERENRKQMTEKEIKVKALENVLQKYKADEIKNFDLDEALRSLDTFAIEKATIKNEVTFSKDYAKSITDEIDVKIKELELIIILHTTVNDFIAKIFDDDEEALLKYKIENAFKSSF